MVDSFPLPPQELRSLHSAAALRFSLRLNPWLQFLTAKARKDRKKGSAINCSRFALPRLLVAHCMTLCCSWSTPHPTWTVAEPWVEAKCSAKCHGKQSQSEHRTMFPIANIHFPSRPIISHHLLSSNILKPWHTPNKKFVNQNDCPNMP